MSEFHLFKVAVSAQMDKMTAGTNRCFRANITGEEVWETYLKSFAQGTNPIFRERTEHDCQCCRQFIKAVGNMVAIVDNELVSIWDIDVPAPYKVVAEELDILVTTRAIRSKFYNFQKDAGTDHSLETMADGHIHTWNHFHYALPRRLVRNDIAAKMGVDMALQEVTKRSLLTITRPAIDTVLELIAENSLYKGQENETKLKKFRNKLTAYNNCRDEAQRHNFTWLTEPAPIRNSSIGTLLVELSEGMDLEKAVARYEAKVAPQNYKRSSKLITKGMIQKAYATVQELGIENSLQRRHAKIEDISINNVLWADRDAKKAMNVFDELADEVQVKPPTVGNIEEIHVDKFISDVLPTVKSMRILMENRHTPNLVSLVAPEHPDANPIQLWDNNFSWSYNGEVTDSISERIKRAGGDVTGFMNFRLGWFNSDDLDAHCVEENGDHIYYSNKGSSVSGGTLDVDMNATGIKNPTDPVENITWKHKGQLLNGKYLFSVNQYTQRTANNPGFEAELVIDGMTYSYAYPRIVKGTIDVAEVSWDIQTHTYSIKHLLPEANMSREIWGIKTHTMQKVSCVMTSPNYWDGQNQGNKHWFFMIEGAMNPDRVRGFYNEFLTPALHKHRKVFEVLGSKMVVSESDQQLSGLGFSSTKSNSVILEVSGAFTRQLKVVF